MASEMIPFPNRDKMTNRVDSGQNKQMPQNLAAEQDVLGGCLADGTIVGEVAEVLEPEDFYRQIHQDIYRQILWLHEAAGKCSLIDLGEILGQEGKLEEVGGMAYLQALVENCAAAADSPRHAKIVLDKSRKRKAILVGEELIRAAFADNCPADDVIEDHSGKVFELGHSLGSGGYKHISVAVEESKHRFNTRRKNPGAVVGLKTGFPDLDTLINGLQPKQFTVLAGRTSGGKSALGMQIAHNVAKLNNVPVAVVHLEMGMEQVVDRMVAQVGGINSSNFSTGFMTPEEVGQTYATYDDLSKLQLHYDDEPGQSVFKMVSRARRLAMKHEPALIVVDFLQLAHSGMKGQRSRVTEVDAVAQALADMSRTFNCAVIALAQLNRKSEDRENKEPQMSDLREAGGIEQAAGVVGLIHRLGTKEDKTDNRVELIIAKNRTGRCGNVHLRFFGEHARFENAEQIWEVEHSPRAANYREHYANN